MLVDEGVSLKDAAGIPEVACTVWSKIRNQSVVVERKVFQVKSEDCNGGTWISITERSRGFVVSLGFGEEETGWLVEQLEKAVDLEASRGFIRKMRGKTRTHLMEICFNSRGRYMKITEYVAKRKPLVLVVPRGVNGCGWENLRKVIVSVQEFSVQAERDSKEKQKKPQESKGMYRGERSYADVVAEKGTRNGAEMPVGKWARAGKLSGFKSRVSQREESKWGRVTKVARKSLKFVDLTKVTLGGDASKCRASSAIRGRRWRLDIHGCSYSHREDDGEDDGEDSIRPESNRSKDELRSAGGCVLQKPQTLRGYELLTGPLSAIAGCLVIVPFSFFRFKIG
ncbi:hypothetical protein CK203_095348 [Vitis vinifera]|uniref:DUF4283 domain-containing protein n=1 Tax=Vitis vinifera TaxID=29760 RepID=A0A438E6Q1_VITVI|nr:hypothetical protein CK203_095348 [Vitis vinifera]